MSETWQTLQIARDARLCGNESACAQLLAEVAPDFEYKRLTHRRVLHPFVLDEGDPYEDYDEPESRSDQRRSWALGVLQSLACDWSEWLSPLELSSFDAILREVYSPQLVSEMAMRRPAVYADPDGDGIEMRVRSWANVIRAPWYVEFTVDE